MEFSFEYKVNSEISTNTVHASHILMWANYASGNVSTIVVTLATSSYAEPVGDWKKATATYQFKAEIPTRIYAFAYLYGGTGSVSVRGLALKQASSKTSIISLTKDGTTIASSELNLDKYATNSELKVGIDGISATVVKNGEVRSKFALDSGNCTISSGVITFKSNTLVVDSDNFKLSSNGSVSITGSFKSTGTTGNVSINDGRFYMDALNADGNRYNTVALGRTSGSYPSGDVTIYSRRADGTVGAGVKLQGGQADSYIYLYNAYGNADVLLLSGEGNSCTFKGGMNVQGPNGVNVSASVSARSLKWWDELAATGTQTKFKPRSGQNSMYIDWQRIGDIQNHYADYWILTGKMSAW